MSSVLKISNLKKSYKIMEKESRLVLDGINLDITKGEFIGVMGPSGSGKTTFLNIVSGMLKPTSGIVEINGNNINTLKDEELTTFRRKNVGFIFQDFNLLDSLTIKENIMLPMVLERSSTREIYLKVNKLLDILNIEDVMDKYPCETSGGQQQRAAIGRALVNDPSIIFADELTGNLDSTSAGAVMETLRILNEEREVTILLVTHDPFTASYCKKIIFLRDGHILDSIERKGKRQEFFYEILDSLARLGGGKNDLQRLCD